MFDTFFVAVCFGNWLMGYFHFLEWETNDTKANTSLPFDTRKTLLLCAGTACFHIVETTSSLGVVLQ